MQIATWNVNSINARLEMFLGWLAAKSPDVLCLQELKCETQKFPSAEIEALGYACAVHGQKTYNGVAVLSKRGFEAVSPGLSGDADDDQARYLEVVIAGDARPLRLACLYAPNGNPVDSPKYPYKLAWMRRLYARAAALLLTEDAVVLAGDYNVIPRADDVHDPAAWADDALFRPDSRAALRAVINLGYVDAFEAVDGRGGQYTFWDYQAGAWPKDHGIRIDHLLASPQAADRLKGLTIDRGARGLEKPSDHVPVIAEFAI